MNSKSLHHALLPFLLAQSVSAFSATWFVQVGAFKSLANAEKTLHSLNQKTDLPSELIPGKNGLYHVHAGPFLDKKTASQALMQVKAAAFPAFLKEGLSSPNVVKKRNKPKLSTVETVNKKSLIAAPALAGDFSRAIDSGFYGFPYQARGLTDGTWGQITNLGNGDFMFPLVGNDNWIVYFDGAAKYGDDHAWFGSFGGGFRGVFRENIWGAYFFADNNESSQHSVFWFANPGLEFMTPSWDLHLNGYIPLSSKTASFGNFLASELGIPGTQVIGRTFYDPIYRVEEIVGPGIDGEVGYAFENYYRARPFIGGYHFFSLPNGSHINGIEGGIQIPFGDHIQVLIHDAYDSVQKNTAMGTLRIVMGSVPKTRDRNVRERMLDPFERHLGAYQTGAGVPILSYNQRVGTATLSNIWFFSPTGSAFSGISSCTPGSPCAFNQTAIDGINAISPSANLFIAPGTYNNPAVGSGFNIQNGQSLYGRTLTYLRAASGSHRGLLNDTLQLNGNNLITSLQVNGLSTIGGFRSSIVVPTTATGPITVENSALTVSATSTAAAVIYHRGQSRFNLRSSDVTLNSSSSAAGFGIWNTSEGLMVVRDTSLNMSVIDGSGLGSWSGIFSTSPLIVDNSHLNLNIALNGVMTLGTVFGIQASGGLLLNHSDVSLTASNGAAFISGVQSTYETLLNNSSVSVIGNNAGEIFGSIGVNAEGNFKMSNMTVFATNNIRSVAGVGTNNPPPTVLSYQNSTITAEATGTASATPVKNSANQAINNLGGMTCIQIQNGVTTVTDCPSYP